MEKLTSILAVGCAYEEGGERLLAKAVTLARAFDASVNLMVTNGVEVRQYAALCAAKSYEEVLLSSAGKFDVPLEAVILRRVLEIQPDLVIKVPAGKHPLRRYSIGATDWQLAYQCPAPLLLTREKSWTSPPRFAAAVDMSEGAAASLARTILHAAGFLALGCHGRLDVLYSERERRDETLRMARAVRLAQMVREFHVGCERLTLVSGAPERTLPPLITVSNYDCLVLGSQMQAGGVAAIAGSLSARLVEAFGGDVVFVKNAEHVRATAHPREVTTRAAS